MPRTSEWVEALRRWLESRGLTSVDYVQVAVRFDISPSKAREILKAFAVVNEGWVYSDGVLRRSEGERDGSEGEDS